MSQSPRVLVVEDDNEIAGALRRSLRLEGYDVRVTEDGENALTESGVFEPGRGASWDWPRPPPLRP